MEAELSALQSVLEAEREASRSLPEKMELELAEQKRALHSLQEEVQSLSEQLAQAGRVRAELESECRALEQKHRLETEEKDLQICRLQMVEQELRSSHDALVAQNQQLQQDVDRLLVPPTECSAAVPANGAGQPMVQWGRGVLGISWVGGKRLCFLWWFSRKHIMLSGRGKHNPEPCVTLSPATSLSKLCEFAC